MYSPVVGVGPGLELDADAKSSLVAKGKKRNFTSSLTPPSSRAKRSPTTSSSPTPAAAASWRTIVECALTQKCLCSVEGREDVLDNVSSDDVDPASVLDKLTGITVCLDLLKRQKTAGFLCSSLSSFVEKFLSEAEDPPEESLSLLALTSDDEFLSYSASQSALALARFSKSCAIACVHRILKSLVAKDDFVGSPHGFANCFQLLKEACSVRDAAKATDEESACPPESCEMCLVDSDEESGDSESEFSFGESGDEDDESNEDDRKHGWDASSLKNTCLEILARSWARIVAAAKNRNLVNSTAFLGLWTTLVSIHSNVPEKWARAFASPLVGVFPELLSSANVSITSWRTSLNVYNEALCYGSTIALLDEVPEEPLNLSRLVLSSATTFLSSVPAGRDFSGLVPGSNSEEPSVLISKSVLLVLKAAAIRTKAGDIWCTTNELPVVDAWVKSKLPYFHPGMEAAEWVVRLLSSQDDVLVEALVCLLDIYTVSDHPRCISPHSSFRAFLSTLAFDPTVLLDYLVSDDTYFLLYLLRYLKLLAKAPGDFVAAMSSNASAGGSSDDLDACVRVLGNLRDSVKSLTQQKLFPYNVSPLLKVLETCLAKLPPPVD